MSHTSEKPLLMPAILAHKRKQVSYRKDGSAVLRLSAKKIALITPDHQYDLTQATIFGLNERLTLAATSPVIDQRGGTLREQFNTEWTAYAKTLEQAAKQGRFDYGVFAYYERAGDLVRYAPAYWHKVVSMASNSMLIADPKHKLTWKEIREIFDATTVGVVGASVGGSILHTVVMDLRPNHIKVADKSLYKLENVNRVRVKYSEMVESNAYRKSSTDSLLRNKAIVTAEQIYAIDPFITVHTYKEGVNQTNIDQFFKGAKGEPKLDILVEEVDDAQAKITLREYARKHRIPLLMVSDFGSNVQLDISRYDLNPKLPLTYGTTDKQLHRATAAVYSRGGEKAAFFDFVDALVGTDYRAGELDLILNEKCEIPTSTIIPQLGSTISTAAGIMAETIARIRLGWKHHPRRMVFNKRDFTVKLYT
jgi:hypothetical protein